MTTAIARYSPAHGTALFRLRGLLADLQGQIGELERAYARDVDRLRQFQRRFHPAVGRRFDELERLREKIDRAWAELASNSPGGAGEEQEPAPEHGARAPVPSARAGARSLFLELARHIHPDLGADPDERKRRHEVMAEATLAYRDGDERRLQWLLEHWQAQSGPVGGVGLDAAWARTNRQLAWCRYRLRELRHASGKLHASPIARLMQEHEQARLSGRNLILELRRQVRSDLEDALGEADRVRAAIDELEPSQRAAVREASGL